MSSSQLPISYAAAAASAASDAAQLTNIKASTKQKIGDRVSTRKDGDNTINSQLETMKLSYDRVIGLPRQSTESGGPTSHTTTGTSASDDGNDSHSRLSFASQASSNNVSAIENAANTAPATKSSPSLRPMLSIWTGAASARTPPEGFNPLSSIGSASARPVSPFMPTRKSRFSRFFSAMENGGGSDSPGSPLFADGLSGGLVSAMADIKTQQRKMGEDVKAYVTSHYASPGPTADPSRNMRDQQWNEYIASIQDTMDSIPVAASGNATNPLQTSVGSVSQGGQPDPIGNPRLSAPNTGGALPAQRQESKLTVHNPRAPPFIPRGSTTIENLEQVAKEHDEQRRLTFTRPRSSWDQVPNWRTRGKGQGKGRVQGSRQPPAPLPSGDARRAHGMWQQNSTFGRGNMSRDTQSLSAGPLVPSTVARDFSSSSSQALTTTQSTSSALGAIGKRDTTRRTFEPFRPMNAVLNPDAFKQPLSEEDIAFRVENGISLNYHGNHENPRNISAKISEMENCAVWITNLPPRCTHKDLLQALMHHRPGRVWATHINAPEAPRHRYAAGKVVFYHPLEAKRMLALSQNPGIFVRDRRISVIYNKQRVATQEYTYPTSRALEIRGDKAIVNEKFLRSLFESHFMFEDEAVEVLAEFEHIRVIEWRFGSMRAQAGSAYKLLERMYPCVDIRYATDPCAQYMVLPSPGRMDQLGPEPQSSFGAPVGSRKMPWSAYN